MVNMCVTAPAGQHVIWDMTRDVTRGVYRCDTVGFVLIVLDFMHVIHILPDTVRSFFFSLLASCCCSSLSVLERHQLWLLRQRLDQRTSTSCKPFFVVFFLFYFIFPFFSPFFFSLYLSNCLAAFFFFFFQFRGGVCTDRLGGQPGGGANFSRVWQCATGCGIFVCHRQECSQSSGWHTLLRASVPTDKALL